MCWKSIPPATCLGNPAFHVVRLRRNALPQKGSHLLCSGKQPYELIAAEKANFPITLMCQVLDVARSGYYAWRQRKPCTRTQENQILSQQIQQIHQSSRGTYGSPRIHASLGAKGFQVGRQRVVRLMAKLGISARPRRKFRVTPDSEHPLPIAENLLGRGFTTPEPDRAWVADMTYIPTSEGWLYLAMIIDLFSRRVVGWSMAEHLRTEVVLSALEADWDTVSLLRLGCCSILTGALNLPVGTTRLLYRLPASPAV